MKAIPLTMIVERHYKEVGALQVLQNGLALGAGLLGPGAANHVVA